MLIRSAVAHRWIVGCWRLLPRNLCRERQVYCAETMSARVLEGCRQVLEVERGLEYHWPGQLEDESGPGPMRRSVGHCRARPYRGRLLPQDARMWRCVSGAAAADVRGRRWCS